MTPLATLLRAVKITPRSIAKDTGLTLSTVNNLIAGRHDPHVSTLALVAKRLNDMPVPFLERLVGRKGTHHGKPALSKARTMSNRRDWGATCPVCNLQIAQSGDCGCS